jgi:hypothetical protein
LVYFGLAVLDPQDLGEGALPVNAGHVEAAGGEELEGAGEEIHKEINGMVALRDPIQDALA